MTLRDNNGATSRRALTAIELLLVLCVLFIFVIILLPSFGSRKSKPTLSRCSANVKQVSLAFLIWAGDSKTSKFPWEVASPTGTLQNAESSEVFRHFAAVSNQLQDFRSLLCPGDKSRKRAASWSALQNKNISYFINLASANNWELVNLQNVIILGDRNLSTNHNILSGYREISDPTSLRWTKDIHQHRGNVALADGSVHQESIIGVQSRFTNLTVRLAIP